MPSQAVAEGLSLLSRGVEVIKFSQKGSPSLVLLKLSKDEKTITWSKHGISKLKRKAERREIVIQMVVQNLQRGAQ